MPDGDLNELLMKKIYPLIFIVVLLSACTPGGPGEAGYGKDYVLKGTMAMDGFAWTNTAAIGLYSADDASVGNAQFRIDGWYGKSRFEGETEAEFHGGSINPGSGKKEYLVYSPYSKEIFYSPSQRRMFDFKIPNSQTVAAPGKPGLCPAVGLAKGDLSGGRLDFELKPIAAAIDVSIASAEYDGYTISRVQIADDSKKTALAGKYDFSVDTLKMYLLSGFSTVSASVSKPDTLRGGQPQTIRVYVYPGDYSEKTFTLTITLNKGTASVALPINMPGMQCEAGKVASFAVADLKTSDNKVGPWFCPFDSRELPGPGYAYGEANTYLIQSKSAVYAGGTLSPDAEIPEEVTIDYRLRGDYTNGEAPEGVTFEWAQAAGSMWVPRNDGKFVSNQFSFTVDAANYKVKVKNNGSTAGAPILLMKKGGKILWGWSFWNIAADGTTMDPVKIGDYDFAPLEIGMHTSKYGDFLQGTSAGHMSRSAYYYQWGRYLPMFWNSWLSVQWSHSAEGQGEQSGNGNVLGMNGPYKTIAEAFEHPAGVIVHVGAEDLPKWADEDISSLWGCIPADEPGVGKKSIYDPCPKGWRVPDYAAMKAVVDACGDTPTYALDAGQLGLNVGSARFLYLGYFETAKKLASSTARFTGGGIAGTTGSGYPSYFWANCMPAEGANTAYTFRYYHNNSEKVPSVATFTCANSAPVRCMKDADNR